MDGNEANHQRLPVKSLDLVPQAKRYNFSGASQKRQQHKQQTNQNLTLIFTAVMLRQQR